MKKKSLNIFSFIMIMVLTLVMSVVTTLAAGSKSNISLGVTPLKVETGEKITVLIQNNKMTVESFTSGFSFDKEYFEVTRIVSSRKLSVVSTLSEANASGNVGLAIIGTKDATYLEGTLVKVELKAKKTGKTKISYYEDSTGKDGFTKDPVGSVNVEVTQKGKSGRTFFNDVKDPNDWFYETVYTIADTVNGNGKALMSGYKDGSGNFGAVDPLTRQDFAVILYRLANEPAVTKGKNPYPDADPKGYYYESILWAKTNKVITGYDNGKFGVGDNITREQVATILYRYAKDYLKLDTAEAKQQGNLSRFKDAQAVSNFAKDALAWANGAGVITGKDNGTRIDPQGNAARAEIAAMIIRFTDYMIIVQ